MVVVVQTGFANLPELEFGARQHRQPVERGKHLHNSP
jgi:hypothetical protein